MDVEKTPGPVTNDDYILICNMNIRSINAKANYPGGLTRFEAFKNAVTNTYDVVTLTETWLQHEHPTESYALPGFIGPFRNDRSDNTGHGGVAAWVRNSLVSKRRDDLEELNHESLWLQIANKQKQILLCVTYRQKIGNYAPTYWGKLQSSYEKALRDPIMNIVLIGDFNGDPSSDVTVAQNLNDFVALNNLHHHIFDPTRVVPGQSETRLDLILTNLPQLVIWNLKHDNYQT
jgi:hypothetical protein